MSRAFSKVLILTVFIIFAIGGIFVWQYWWSPEEIQKGTVDWEAYKDRWNGFEIKYPPGSIVTDWTERGYPLGPPGIYIVSEEKVVAGAVEDNPSQLSPRDLWDSGWDLQEEFTIKDITLAESPAIEVTIKTG